MAISTVNGVISGLQMPILFAKGNSAGMVAQLPQSFWPVAGSPAAGVYDTTAAGLARSSPVTGQLFHSDPPGGTNAYLGRFQNQWNAAAGVMMLCDRLWDGRPAVNDTTNQTINSAAWPARDVAGSTNGDGVLIGLEVAATSSATAAVISSYTYTNQSGTGSRTGVFLDLPTTATFAGRFFRLTLQAGDTGVRSIQNIQFSTAWTSGSINLVAYRVLAIVESAVPPVSAAVDAITSAMPQLFNGTVPFMIAVCSSSSAMAPAGHYIETQG